MDYTPRILLIICLIAGGLVYPWLWLGALLAAVLLYVDVAPHQHKQSDGRFPVIGEGDEDWLQKIRGCTESKAEVAFLDLMVAEYDLKPKDRALRGVNIIMRTQVEALRYRLDFLVDETLVVEIDGMEWHSSPEAVARDHNRDAALVQAGYTILRIPAKTVFYNRPETLRLVREMRPKAAEAYQRGNRKRLRALRSGLNPIALINTANVQIKKAGDVMEEASLRAREYRDARWAEEHDSAGIDAVLADQEEVMVEIEAVITPDPASKANFMTIDHEKEIRGRLAELRDPAMKPATLSKATGRLRGLHEKLRLLKELRKLQEQLDADDRLREIFNSLDDRHFDEVESKNAT